MLSTVPKIAIKSEVVASGVHEKRDEVCHLEVMTYYCLNILLTCNLLPACRAKCEVLALHIGLEIATHCDNFIALYHSRIHVSSP